MNPNSINFVSYIQSSRKVQTKFINSYTDFGFKKIFGEKVSRQLCMPFLNTLLPDKPKISSWSFKKYSCTGGIDDERKVVYDICCERAKDEKFIVELQRAKQNYIKERTMFHSIFPITEQGEKRIWDYSLKAVYYFGILDFTFDDNKSTPERSEVLHTGQLKNRNNKVFDNKLTFVYLEMLIFNKGKDGVFLEARRPH